MAWNEPGGNKNDKDPWGNGGGRGNDQGPPDLDEALKKGLEKLNKLFGGKKGGSGNSQGGDSGNGGGYGAILAIIAIIAVGYVLYESVYTVDAQEEAVVLRFGEYYKTEDPGLQFKVPLIDTITKVRVTNLRTAKSEGQMLTQDQNLVEVKLQVQYKVSNARDYVLNVRDSNQALAFATDSALRHEVGSMKLDNVLTEGRATLSDNVEKRLQTFLKDYTTGLTIAKVNLENTQPPDEVQEAFRDVQRAKEDQQRLKEKAQTYSNRIVPEARGSAQRMEEEASAYKSKVVERANGETARFLALLGVYKGAPQVTRDRMYIDTMQSVFSKTSKVLVDAKGSNNMMYLPLDQLLKRQSGQSKDASAQGDDSSGDTNIQSLTDQVLREVQSRNSNSSVREGRQP